MVGNKCDLNATFDLKQCERYAEEIGASFTLTSALRGEGVEEVFSTLVNSVYDTYNFNTMEKKKSSYGDSLDILKVGKPSSNARHTWCC